MKKNRNAFQRFAEILDTMQSRADSEFDIREFVLSQSQKKVGIGYASENLNSKFGANLPNLFPNCSGFDGKGFEESEIFLGSGTCYRKPENTHKGLVELFSKMPQGAPFVFFESTFLATTHSWVESFKGGNPAHACLGYVYDDMAHYFMADYPNRLMHRLNSEDALSASEMTRARTLIDRIVDKRITKYNAQPMRAPSMTEGFESRVLVVDQAFADASTVYGKADEATFEKMLLAALSENPNAEVIVKTHPDSSWKKGERAGYYSHLAEVGRLRLLREPINPYVVFDLVDRVYVASSQMGFEALMAGKEVVCFGAPFYSGWGLTDDRQVIPHRHRQRTLEELFHFFYIWYSIYHVPGLPAPSEIEDVLTYIEKNRPFALDESESHDAENPKVSVIIPVHGVERYLSQCLTSIQNQTLRDIEIIPVNDVSPDNSQHLIDRLASEDSRIRPLILKENVGQGFARNAGLEKARGEYVWFIDGDDWLESSEFLEKAYELASGSSVDMLRTRKAYEAVFDDVDRLKHTRPDFSEKFFEEEIEATTYAESPIFLKNRHFWNWLYKREFLDKFNIRFKTGQWEERAFLVQALVNAGKIKASTLDSTAYRVRQASTARRERTATDYQLMLRNFRETFNALGQKGAVDRKSPLREHLNYHISQFVQHLLMRDAYRHFRDVDVRLAEDFRSDVRKIFTEFDFRSEDFSENAISRQCSVTEIWRYKLAIAAVRCDHLPFLHAAIDYRPIEQGDLYTEFLQEPLTDDQIALQAAANGYARNEHITSKASDGFAGKKPKIIIHIGTTKTGSTFIQHFLDANRPALLRKGIMVPEVGLFWQKYRAHKQAGHVGFTRAALKKEAGLKNHIEAGLAHLDGEVHTIVLSSEAFFLHDNALKIPDYFNDYDVEMVVYLRRQDEWANAQYCEYVAGGAVGRVSVPFADWIKEEKTQKLLDYSALLKKWEDKIGASNVHVRIFEKSKLENGDVLDDFAVATNLPDILDLPRPSEANQNSAQLSAAHVELIRQFNEREFEDRDAYFCFIEEATQCISELRALKGKGRIKPWVLSAQQSGQIMHDNAEGNLEIATNHFGKDNIALFTDTEVREDKEIVEPEEVERLKAIYEKYKPKPKPKRSLPPSKLWVINYGLFGWRLWLLSPIVGWVLSLSLDKKEVSEFKKEPALFAHENWAESRPLVSNILYPNGNVLGPWNILGLWKPVIAGNLRKTGNKQLVQEFDKKPIKFVRQLDSRYHRILCRLIFPFGELRRTR